MKPLRRIVRFIACNRLVLNVRKGTNHMLKHHFLLTNMAIASTISCVGDCIQQKYEKHRHPERIYNYRRTFNMGLTGMLVSIICHFWYIKLDKIFPGRGFKIAMQKMLLDQTACSPVTITVFLATLTILEGSSFEDFLDDMRNKAWRLYIAEWIVWPPFQLFNFIFLPLRFRVLYDNAVSMICDIYSSYVKYELPGGVKLVSAPSCSRLNNKVDTSS